MIAKKMPCPKIGKLMFGDGEVIDLDFYLNHDYTSIEEASQQLPGIIEYLNEKLQYYVQTEQIEKQEIKEAEATVYFRLRSGEFLERYGEKMTEAALEKAVVLDDVVKNAHRIHAESDAWCERLKRSISSLTAKMELVRTTEATRRHTDALSRS